MLDFLLSIDNAPFTVALLVLCMLGLIETVGLLVGASLSDTLSALLPVSLSSTDLDIHGSEAHGVVARFMTWLRIGRLPLIVIIVIFLTCFSVLGFIVQSVIQSVVASRLPWWLAVIPVWCLSLPLTRLLADQMLKVMPESETEAVSRTSLIGKVAVIMQGESRHRYAAQAQVRDYYQLVHYVMVEPDYPEDIFTEGQHVVLVRETDGIFYAIPNPSPHLQDDI